MKRSIQRSTGQSEAEVLKAVTRSLSFREIKQVLRETRRESVRLRCLPAHLTVLLVILMGYFRRVSYENLMEKFRGTTWTRTCWKKGKHPASTSLSQARDRVGLEPFQILFERIVSGILSRFSGLVFHGRRVFGLDGSTCKTADTKENHKKFGRPGASRGRAAYPQLRVATLVDIGTRIVSAMKYGPYITSEIALAWLLLPFLPQSSLVLMDRYFYAYDLLWEIWHEQKRDFVVRMPCKIKPKVLYRIGRGDYIVEVSIPRYYRKDRPDMPKTWRLRMTTYRPLHGKETIRLLSTLTDHDAIKCEEIAALYHDRWDVETCIDEIKTHLCDCATVNRAVVFRSKTPERVEQELYGLLLAYNSIRNVMVDVAEETGGDALRLSFTAALERLRECLRDMVLSRLAPADRVRFMRESIGRSVVPKRSNRHFPRVVKIKMSKYLLKHVGRRA